MGNQITTAKTPNEILPVERYLSALQSTVYESSLGSTRFLKVAKAKSQTDGLSMVVKVFVIQDPSLSLKKYATDADYITKQLGGATNCMPFQYSMLSDKAGFLVRQYIKYNLYDRLSTRPFLSAIEKKWVAFQLLSALSQCFNHKICHGDIKSENVMITSWNWALLTDFANFKPPYLPENNPSDYNYFFDTSRRRTCYIAPERFQQASIKSSIMVDILPGDDAVAFQGELTHAMDIFSLGCVLIELFTDGKVPFTLAQLLSYKKGKYSPWKIVDTIPDRHIRELVNHMIQQNPAYRLSSEEYLLQQKGKAFPSYFYTYLKVYIQSYRSPKLFIDERIALIQKDLPTIIRNTGITSGQDAHYEPLVLILEIVTSSIRELQFCESKLNSLDLLLELTEYLPAEITLDRVIPHMMYLLDDSIGRVKAAAIRAVTMALSNISQVPKNEANIFPDYILPAMNNLATHESVVVRVALAENISILAETAVRFLNLSQATADQQNRIDYEAELRALHELVQVKVVSLLSDEENSVKMAMLHSSITRLAVIFGKQKASDVLLSHMITFLNDKQDWLLRSEFFQCISGIASYIGWQSTSVLQPLIEQGLNDPEEFVVRKCLEAWDALISMKLMRRASIRKLLEDISPLLCHPNEWIRDGVAKCISTVATLWHAPDVLCIIIPLIKPYLRQQALQVNRLDVLLHCLHDPIPRPVLDFLIKSNHLNAYFSCLEDRQLERNITKPGHVPAYPPQFELISQISKKLSSLGLTEEHEDRLLRMRDFIMKQSYQHKNGANTSKVAKLGIIDISQMKIQRRHADLLKPESAYRGIGSPANPSPMRQKSVPNLNTNTVVTTGDVRSLFTGTDILDAPMAPPTPTSPYPQQTLAAPTWPESKTLSYQQSMERMVDVPDSRPSSMSIAGETLTPQQRGMRATSGASPVKQSRCKLDLRALVHHKRDEYSEDYRNKEQIIANVLDDSFNVSTDWKPQGILVSHVHEHKDYISRILVSPTQDHMITGSKDGTVRVWDTYRSDQRGCNISRSRSMYSNKQGGKIMDMTFCTSDNWVACLTSKDSINLINIETGDQANTVYNVKNTHSTDIDTNGHMVALAGTEYGPKTVINYGTVNGYILGWDIRANRVIYKLRETLDKGLITCMTSHTQEKWLSVGTSRGSITLYDMRFHLPVNSILPTPALRVHRLVCHPTESSWVIGTKLGNNEVSMWNLETKQRQRTLWASELPLFHNEECTKHWINGLHVHHDDSKSFIITGGTDMRLRYWDLNHPSESKLITEVATYSADQRSERGLDKPRTITKYQSQVVDGTDCIKETYMKVKSSAQNYSGGKRPDQKPPRDKPHPGHHDMITDVAMYHTTQPFIVSASACGVVKVWK